MGRLEQGGDRRFHQILALHRAAVVFGDLLDEHVDLLREAPAVRFQLLAILHGRCPRHGGRHHHCPAENRDPHEAICAHARPPARERTSGAIL
jgi:hypothetical protein